MLYRRHIDKFFLSFTHANGTLHIAFEVLLFSWEEEAFLEVSTTEMVRTGEATFLVFQQCAERDYLADKLHLKRKYRQIWLIA